MVEGVRWILGGDILPLLNGRSTSDPEAFSRATRSLTSGQLVHVEILRRESACALGTSSGTAYGV